MEQNTEMEQANTYIEQIAELYNVSDKVVEKMKENKETIQQELQNFFPYDIKVAINKHYKYKNDKERPKLAQIIAQLTGIESIEKKTKEQIEMQRFKTELEISDNFKNQCKKSIEKYKFSSERKELINQGIDCFKLDNLMQEYITVQAMLLNPLPDGSYIGCGLDCEFSHIKPITYETEQYLTYTDYLRSKSFLNKVKNNKSIDLSIPEDIKNHLLQK